MTSEDNTNANQGVEQGAALAQDNSQQASQQNAKIALLVMMQMGADVRVAQPWPARTEIMEGMIDGKLVKQTAHDIIAINVANGRAEYQIDSRAPDGTLILTLLPGFSYMAPTDEAKSEAPARTVDANGRHII